MEINEIEKTIIKKYRKTIWTKFIKSINEYDLIQDNDRIAVCISGGKDSFLMAKCFQELQKHGKIHFDLEFIVMDPGYKKENIELIKENAKILNIPINIFKAEIFDYVNSLNEGSPCYLCARMRRGYLYNKAQELNCNKISLGHHFDDVIETILLSILYGAEVKTMMPKLKSTNYKNIELIRPMYYIREKDVIAWSKYCNLEFLNCACKFTMDNVANEETSKRKEIKHLINDLSKKNKYIENNIFKSVYNVNLNTIIGYSKDSIKHNFLDEYKK